MKIGTQVIYECPTCSNLVAELNILSIHNTGATYFSDGKSRPSFNVPDNGLTKCHVCNSIFWVNKWKEVGKYEMVTKTNPLWKNIRFAPGLDLNDNFFALEKGMATTAKEEYIIRLNIWRLYNERYLGDIDMYENEADKIRWEENIKALMPFIESVKF